MHVACNVPHHSSQAKPTDDESTMRQSDMHVNGITIDGRMSLITYVLWHKKYACRHIYLCQLIKIYAVYMNASRHARLIDRHACPPAFQLAVWLLGLVLDVWPWGHRAPPLLGLLLHPDGPADESVVAIAVVVVWSGFMAGAIVVVVAGAAAARRPGLPAPTVGTADKTTTMSTRAATAIAVVPAGLSTLAMIDWSWLDLTRRNYWLIFPAGGTQERNGIPSDELQIEFWKLLQED